MSYFTDISLRRGVAIIFAALSLLVAGTWLTVKFQTETLLDQDAKEYARNWARFIAVNVPDLEQIAAGELPSNASLTFFNATRRAGNVFRYVIFNKDGYSQLVADHAYIGLVEVSEFDAEAARAAKTRTSVVGVARSVSGNSLTYLAQAFVPVVVNGQTIAVVAAMITQDEQRASYYYDILIGSIVLCLLTAISFGIPAYAWFRSTQEKQKADRRIRYLAHHDVLTGLTNRARLMEKLDTALASLPVRDLKLALHIIDVDHFKQVNDRLGHDAGDFLLNTIGQRLRAMTRAGDIVARLGGDEFVVVQTAVADKAQAEAFAQRIGAVLSKPLSFKDETIVPSCTIGVAVAPADGTTIERLLKSADVALYDGKAAGRNCIRSFSPAMDEAQQKRLELEKIVSEAIAEDKLLLYYQPVYEIASRKLVGFEALARLTAPDGTIIGPATFIPIAEECRLIDKIGAWVLHEACRTAAIWPDHLTVAVNLSPAQFESGTVEATVADALRSSGLRPQRLELEITEMLMLHDTDAVIAALKRLKAMGVSIVMDDFGTGYSSLSYLLRFPFDKVKIDRSFMENFDKSKGDMQTLIKSIIALGKEMKMKVTVEGVETQQQADFLSDSDADQVQGFYFGKPIPAGEVGTDILTDLYKAQKARAAAVPKLRIVS